MGRINANAKVLMGLAVVAVLAGVVAISVAFAETPTPTATPDHKTFYSEFIDKLAAVLGKTPQETQAAITQAQKDLVNDALKQGKITQQQADKAIQSIDKGGFAFLGHRFGKRGFPWAGFPWAKGRQAMGFGLNSVAEFLGISQDQLRTELRGGKSLAQVAQDHGKTRDQLKDAIVSSARDALNKAMTNGKLTQEKADSILKKLQDNIDTMIDRTFKAPERPRRT